MKRFTLFLGASLLLLLANCDKKPSISESLPCGDGCLFALKDAAGTIVRMDCFNRFAIEAKHPETDSTIYGIPDKLDAKFEQVGKSVTFSGTFRQNTLTPTFPDPNVSPETLFQMEIADIR